MSVAAVVASEIARLREEAATNLTSLRTEMEERYRAKFQKYKRREEALLEQVKHAVERAEQFGKYQATEEFETKLALLTAQLTDSKADARTVRRRLQEASRLGEKRRLDSEVRAQQARNEATTCGNQVEELRVLFRAAVQDIRVELHGVVKKELYEQVCEQLTCTLRPQIESSLRSEMLSVVQEDLEEELRADVIRSLAVRMRPQVEQALRREMEAGLRSSLTGLTRSRVVEDLSTVAEHIDENEEHQEDRWIDEYGIMEEEVNEREEDREGQYEEEEEEEGEGEGEVGEEEEEEEELQARGNRSSDSNSGGGGLLWTVNTSTATTARTQSVWKDVEDDAISRTTANSYADWTTSIKHVVPKITMTTTTRGGRVRTPLGSLKPNNYTKATLLEERGQKLHTTASASSPLTVGAVGTAPSFRAAPTRRPPPVPPTRTNDFERKDLLPLLHISRTDGAGGGCEEENADAEETTYVGENNYVEDNEYIEENANVEEKDTTLSAKESEYREREDEYDEAEEEEENEDELQDMPCRSSRHQRRFMRAMIVGQGSAAPRNLHHQYAPMSEDEEEEEEEETDYSIEQVQEYEEEHDAGEYGEYGECEECEEYEEYEEEEYTSAAAAAAAAAAPTSTSDLLLQWRNEIAHQQLYEKEVSVPLRPSGNDFVQCATLAAQLFELWTALGVSYQARRKTLRGLHAAAQRENTRRDELYSRNNKNKKSKEQELLIPTMKEMKSKLEHMLPIVRREMAAVRKCDELLRLRGEIMQGNGGGAVEGSAECAPIRTQLGKLVSVLQRVLPKWEQTHGRPFLFRGFRYLNLMEELI